MTRTTQDVPTSEANGIHEHTSVEMSTNLLPQARTSLDESSDGDGGERPVREKLKKTSIAALAQHSRAGAGKTEPDMGLRHGEGQQKGADDPLREPRGRLGRKRSYHDLQNDGESGTDMPASQELPAPKEGFHKRMRSRDATAADGNVINGSPEAERAHPLEHEENDREAHVSPGGPGVLVDAPSPIAMTPPEKSPYAITEEVMSPKKKRSRDQFDKDLNPTQEGSEDSEDSIVPSGSEGVGEGRGPVARSSSRPAKGEPEKKRHRDASVEVKDTSEVDAPAAKVQTSSGLADKSTISQFAPITSPKSPFTAQPVSATDGTAARATSPAAFASSGLSAFASSERSGFGALGAAKTASHGFGGPAATGGFGPPSGFGGASPFATKTSSGLSGLGGSGFGGGFGAGFGTSRPFGGLSSFAGPTTSSSSTIGGFGIGPSVKSFGAPADEEEDENSGDEGGGDPETEGAEEKPRDRRFHEQDVETGEEDEETIFSCRAKLYHFEGREWKERGVGNLKVNMLAEHGTTLSDRKPRLIMRTDGVHRVILNTPVFKGMKVGTPEGGEPTGKTMNLTGMEDGRPALFILKIGKEDLVKDLYHRMMKLQEDF